VDVKIMEELIQCIEIDEGGSRDFHAERLTTCREGRDYDQEAVFGIGRPSDCPQNAPLSA
jgi:hypothetical protein